MELKNTGEETVMKVTEHEHKWREVYKTTFLGPHYKIGYKCVECNKFVGTEELTPAGIGGTVLKGGELEGPGECSDGTEFEKQIIDENNILTIIRPSGKIEKRLV